MLALFVRFFQSFSWSLVRSVGELQILTRASYAMLVVVPLLAGTWPAVRAIINSYDKILEESASKLGEVTTKLEKQANGVRTVILDLKTTASEATMQGGATIDHAAAQIEVVARSVETELARLKHQAMLSPFLPASWALAFFAALAVTLGHVIYQSGAPQTVRQLTRDDFVRNAIQEYRENPTERALQNALSLQDQLEWVKTHFPSAQARTRYGRFSKALDELNASNEAAKPRSEEEQLRINIDFMRQVARLRYELISSTKLHLILPTLILYGIGLTIIAYIIVQQSLAVAEATGWFSGTK